MAYGEQTVGLRGSINEHAKALANEWRRLTQAATFVALLTAPAFFLVLHGSNHLRLPASILLTALAVVLLRGLVEVIARRFLRGRACMVPAPRSRRRTSWRGAVPGTDA